MTTKVELFDPALCCPTGVCGTDVNPELTKIARLVSVLTGMGYSVKRYNLAQEPMPFSTNKEIVDLMEQHGVDSLPGVVVNGTLVFSGRYPTISEFAEWFDMAEDDLREQMKTPKKTLNISLNG
ncbi:arsenite efflux transporter metallochaperone ArsD [Salisediminibacterium selenitireducens]|uniref:Arsenical resistance operon trans-acting repressor ArsD n=1 Tax=Bacillus selenitireducens (strain ATCC 700615 / DSM 15326 / MLS10) TaxID=439292 RepID=D6XYX4_BACIE|nr:arsenite efflux transporter metallochaperone ArsD [Salisediminibacterium selenitireducens]ADH98282.1 Arsenical resistance operon trans-acting repressor ArsD [[Bacillus] selenitireducens MLS10]